MRSGLLILCGTYGLVMVFGFAFDLLVQPNTSTIELAKTLFELGLWLAVPVLLLVMLLKAWRLSLFMLLVAGLFVITYVPDFLPRSPEIDESAPQLRVMTFNTKTTSQDLAAVIRSVNADVVALQELSQTAAHSIAELEDAYPYQALHPQPDPFKGQGVLSRYPIEEDAYWEYPNVPYTLGHQRLEIDFDGRPVVLYNTHPWPPLGWESGYNDESHRVVLQDIAARAFSETLPLILVGDFNMTDNFEEYDLLASHYTDSFRHAGGGIGYTFPNYSFEPFPPMLRLDYIWHSEHFESVESDVWGLYGQSDHSPVITVLSLIAPDTR